MLAGERGGGRVAMRQGWGASGCGRKHDQPRPGTTKPASLRGCDEWSAQELQELGAWFHGFGDQWRSRGCDILSVVGRKAQLPTEIVAACHIMHAN